MMSFLPSVFAVLGGILLMVTGLQAACNYIDAHWRVSYNGLKMYDKDNLPDPPTVNQVGWNTVNVSWEHLVMDRYCVDRFIVHVWDVKARVVRHIFNSSTYSTILTVTPCTSLKIQVEMQEDDLPGKPPDSRLTYPAPVALVSQWVQPPQYTQNRTLIKIDRTFSHWSKYFDPAYLKGVEVDWEERLTNPTCIRRGVALVSRLVPGAISDTTKQVKVNLDFSESRIILVLPCHDTLTFTIQILFYQTVKVNGRAERFVTSSSPEDVLMMCPWSEVQISAASSSLHPLVQHVHHLPFHLPLSPLTTIVAICLFHCFLI